MEMVYLRKNISTMNFYENEGIRGEYNKFCFKIMVDGNINRDFRLISKTDLGTLMHEYIHYIQHISTVFGLMNGSLFHETMYNLKNEILNSETIQIPFRFKMNHKIEKANESFKRVKGDSTKITISEYSNYIISTSRSESIQIEFMTNKNQAKVIKVGSLHIKEGMSVICQRLIDEHASHDINPYGIVELICQRLNPNLLKDPIKIIALCQLALNSKNCAYHFYELVILSQDDPELDSNQLYKKYLKSANEFTYMKTKKTLKEMQLIALNRFETSLKKNIHTELQYIPKVINNIKKIFTDETCPLIEVLSSSELSNEGKLASLMDIYGITIIDSVKNESLIYPNNDSDNIPNEFIVLEAQNVVYRNLLSNDKNKPCPYFRRCSRKNDLCWDEPWSNTNNCIYTTIGNLLDLPNKIERGNLSTKLN